MKLKFLLPGVALIVLGALPLVAPGVASQLGNAVGLASSPANPVTYYAHVSPLNYSFIEYPLPAGNALTVNMASGQETVDFFLMNGGNFSAWRQSGGAPSQVYPQSALNVRNYTFEVPSAPRLQDYFLVFTSRSATSSTDVLVKFVSVNTTTDTTLATLPVAVAGVGVIMAAYGARSTGKGKVEVQEVEAKAPPSGGWLDLLGPQAPKCRYCGAALDGNPSFCPTCKRSLG